MASTRAHSSATSIARPHVAQNERPDLEQKKDELTVAIAADQKELKRLEKLGHRESIYLR